MTVYPFGYSANRMHKTMQKGWFSNMRCNPDAIEADRPGDDAVALLAAEVRRLQAVITQLRSSASHISDAGNTLTDAAENARLREAIRRLADQDATLSVQGGNVTVTLDATLADAEREAIENLVHLIETRPSHECYGREAHHLRNLLERMK